MKSDGLMPSFKNLFYKLIAHNFNLFDKEFIDKFNEKLKFANKYDERHILNSISNDFRCIGPYHLEFPRNIAGITGHVFDSFVEIRSSKTHLKTVDFDGIRCETSDLSVIVEYKIYSPRGRFTTSKTITFIQLKLGKYNMDWHLSGKQLYFMRYWPCFRYKNSTYNLDVFGMYPDTCSYYLFAYKDKEYIDSLYIGYRRKSYSVNAFALSTMKLEHIHRSYFAPNISSIIFKDQMLRDYNYRRVPLFLWQMLLQNLGICSVEAERFLDAMFPELQNKDPPINASNPSDELPSVGLKITVGVKFE